MSVAGIPAFLEERQVFIRERSNGLYGPGAYVIANSLCTLPYLFICVVVFAIIWFVYYYLRGVLILDRVLSRLM